MNSSPPTLPSPPSFSKYIRPDQNHHHLEPELSIFEAKKYFNYEESNPTNNQPQHHHHHHNLINLPPPPRLSSSSSIDSSSYGGGGKLRNHCPRSFIATTPTASSEASWNSKTGLLSNPPGAIHVSINHNKKKTACKWLFGSSKCLCSGKKSVQVEDNYKLQQPYKTPPHHFYNKNKISAPSTTAFTFPNEILDPSRKPSSSDPIQSHPRQPAGFAFPSKSRMGSTDIDDMASDASSDLFEIESFSTQTQTTYPIDENPRLLYCPMEEEFDRASEASIEWSVTTAEGFDRASVTGMEIDEMVMKTKRREKETVGSSLLMSCRCEKAVSVAVGPNPVKSGTEESGGGGTGHVSCGSSSSM